MNNNNSVAAGQVNMIVDKRLIEKEKQQQQAGHFLEKFNYGKILHFQKIFYFFHWVFYPVISYQ